MKNKVLLTIVITTISAFMFNANCYAMNVIHFNEPNSLKLICTENNSLIGAEAAKVDTNLTLEDMLTYALQDEYLALERYSTVIKTFGNQRPFTNIINAEKTHISYLEPLFEKYNISLPNNDVKDYVKVPTSLKESTELGIQGEIENIEMYERFLEEALPDDVKNVFIALKKASLNHLRAFKNSLKNY